ncbi:hypothetical protein FDP41_005124 [Naegleria fowleri]|uniref:Major facilitator superfamily (MFS) profile domain-containing protein n=1 Tax=Naegleria fowleri TaxID=5763 RepID=A0A6A5BFQ5_NAEFO|nr:uncharacterized protein FDP41_005124 [Naegleria fowleri]KAF0975797.1 hypothetical protein FDP41_005124 [Naegleria fowleri]CAG4716664.1 unnamed protein product [Naegleria fowleri]
MAPKQVHNYDDIDDEFPMNIPYDDNASSDGAGLVFESEQQQRRRPHAQSSPSPSSSYSGHNHNKSSGSKFHVPETAGGMDGLSDSTKHSDDDDACMNEIALADEEDSFAKTSGDPLKSASVGSASQASSSSSSTTFSPTNWIKSLTSKLKENGQKLKDVLLTKAFLQTMLLNFSITSFCIAASCVGSLINVFAKQTGTTKEQVGIVFTIRGIGSLVTTIIGGLVMDALRKFIEKKIKDPNRKSLYETLTIYSLLIVSILVMAFSLVLMPFGSSLWSLCIVFFIFGVGSGYLGICAQALLFTIWSAMKINVSPFSQLFHFSAGVGLFLGPTVVMVVNAMLGIDNSQLAIEDQSETASLNNIFEPTLIMENGTSILTNGTSTNGFIEGTLISKSVIGTNGVICGFFFISILFFLGFMIYLWIKRDSKYEKPERLVDQKELKNINGDEEQGAALSSHESIDDMHKHASEPTAATQPTTSSRSEFMINLAATILVALALLNYCSAEGTYGNVLYSYMTSTKLLDDYEANMLTSGVWLLFTIGRGVAIPISYFVPPFVMLIIDMMGVTVSISMFWIFSTNVTVMSVASLIYGFSIASLYPTTIAIPASVLKLEITGMMTSLMVLGGSTGAMVGPSATLALFKAIGPKTLFGTVTLNMICLASLFIALYVFGKVLNRKKNASTSTCSSSPDLKMK